MYLINEICAQSCDDDIREVLDNLPKDLEETFNRALLRIPSQRAKMVHRIFLWIAVAKIHLSLDEISEAVSIKIGERQSSPGRRFNHKESMVSWCGNLLHVNEEDETVQFAHRTIVDFITGKPSDPRLEQFHVRVDEADHYAGELCMTYLHRIDFQTSFTRRSKLGSEVPVIPPTIVGHGKIRERIVSRLVRPQPSPRSGPQPFTIDTVARYAGDTDDRGLDTIQTANPFLRYAHQYWILHTDRFQPGVSKTWDMLKNLILDQGHGISVSHVSLPEPFTKSNSSNQLHWAYNNRHGAILRIFLDARDETILRAIDQLVLVSAINGDLEMLEATLRPNTPQVILDRSLLLASDFPPKIPHLTLVRIFMQHDEEGGYEYSRPAEPRVPLTIAQKRDRAQVGSRLISAGSNVRTLDQLDVTVLHMACESGLDELVPLLIESGANPKARSETGLTPLLIACEAGHDKVVERLLENGSHIYEHDHSGRTGIVIASEANLGWVLSVLIASGPDFETSRAIANMALFAACKAGQYDTVMISLESGADLQAADSDGRTALLHACSFGHVSLVLNLLAKGANIHAADNDGRTALLHACLAGSSLLVPDLLAYGADMHATDNEGFTALLYALKFRRYYASYLLLDSGAHPQMLSGVNRINLIEATRTGEAGTVLISEAAEFQHCLNQCLSQAASRGQIETVEWLEKAGADTEMFSPDSTANVL